MPKTCYMLSWGDWGSVPCWLLNCGSSFISGRLSPNCDKVPNLITLVLNYLTATYFTKLVWFHMLLYVAWDDVYHISIMCLNDSENIWCSAVAKSETSIHHLVGNFNGQIRSPYKWQSHHLVNSMEHTAKMYQESPCVSVQAVFLELWKIDHRPMETKLVCGLLLTDYSVLLH